MPYLVREVSDALAAYGVDVARARAQHAAYREALGETVVIPADPRQPDCCFIEDTVVVDGGRALLTHMGRADRRGESEAVGEHLASMGFDVERMEAPATLEGGDVLRVGDRVFVGISERTNRAGIAALERFLGRACVTVPVEHCLHLKSACTAVGENTLLLNPAWIDRTHFDGFEIIEAVDPSALRVPGGCLVSGDAEVPGARRIDVSEFKKADGGLTCLSVPFEHNNPESV